MTQIYLARHGETEWNAIRRVQGWTDIPLSTRGVAQAGALGDRLERIPLTAVYSSDLGRAMETARPAAERHGLTVEPLEELREKRFGDWEGLTQTELERDYAELWHRYHTERDLNAIVPNGETWPQVLSRMASALMTILRDHPGPEDAVLVVGHGGSGRAIILQALQATLPTLLRLHLDNASLSQMDFYGKAESRIVLLNDTSHLSHLSGTGA
jgi:broad specificity phosphatase PhoE